MHACLLTHADTIHSFFPYGVYLGWGGLTSVSSLSPFVGPLKGAEYPLAAVKTFKGRGNEGRAVWVAFSTVLEDSTFLWVAPSLPRNF